MSFGPCDSNINNFTALYCIDMLYPVMHSKEIRLTVKFAPGYNWLAEAKTSCVKQTGTPVIKLGKELRMVVEIVENFRDMC